MESSELTPKLLRKIDESLDNLSRSNDDEKRKALINYLESIVAVTEGSTDDDIMNNLFSKRISSQNRRFTAICLLRLFSLKGFTFDIDKILSLKVYQLFDEVFKNDIYKKLKIDGSMQTFKKESILKDAVSIAEKELSSPIISLTNLSELKTFREKFMRSLGNDFTRSLIIPFLPRTLIDNTRIKNLLGTLDEYLESKASKKAKTLEKAKKANRIINEYRNEAQNFGTYYSNKFLIKLSDQLEYLLQEDLNSWEGSKPASLIVKTSGKKYHFH